MKAILAFLCVVVLASAHRGPHHGPNGQMIERPTGRPDRHETWQGKLEQMKKDHEEKMKKWKQWVAARPTGIPAFLRKPSWWGWFKDDQDSDETEILSPFQTHLDSFQSKSNDMLSQNKGSYLDGIRNLYKLYAQHQADMRDARPTGRPTMEDRNAYYKAYKDLYKAYQDARGKVYKQAQQQREAERQKKLEALKQSAAPFMVHIDNFKDALDNFLDQNPDATESQLWKMLQNLYNQAHDDMLNARPTGRPTKEETNAHRFAHSALHKAKDDARKTVGQVVQKIRTEAQRTQAGPYLTHVDAFQTAFENFLASNPKGSSSELRKMFNNLFKKHHEELENSRPTGRPSYEDRKAYWAAHQMIHKHKYDAKNKMAAWKKQMAQLMKDSGADN